MILSLVNPATNNNALFTAWSPWSAPSQAWITNVRIDNDVQNLVKLEFNWSTTAIGAFNTTVWPVTNIELQTDQTLHFFVQDNILGDNRGGVSILFTPTPPVPASSSKAPVPEPSTVVLMGIGLVVLAGGAARRRWKKKAVDKG